jgi:hypothetical protein
VWAKDQIGSASPFKFNLELITSSFLNEKRTSIGETRSLTSPNYYIEVILTDPKKLEQEAQKFAPRLSWKEFGIKL